MICEHLLGVEKAITSAGFKETYRGAPWTDNCREWVYFDCVLDVERIREHFDVAACVQNHAHRGTHDGQEAGLICDVHKDALMGLHPLASPNAKRFSP